MPQEFTIDELRALKKKSTLVPQDDGISPEELKKLKTGSGYKQSEDPSVLEGWRGKFRGAVAPLVRSGLVNGGRAVGLATGIELGPGALGTSLVGGMAGDQVYQQMQKLFPDMYGENRNGVVDSVKESANNSALEMIGNDLFGKASKYLGDTIPKYIPGTEAWKINKMRANHTPEEITALANAPKDLNMSAGQITNSKGWQQVEDLLGSSAKKHNIVEPAKKVIREEVDKIGQSVARRSSYNLNEPYTVRGTNAQTLAKGAKEGYKAGVDDAYSDFRNNYKHRTWVNSATVDPQTGVVQKTQVQSPIFMDKTQEAAREIIGTVDTLLQNPAINGLDETVQKLTQMRKAADGFINLPKSMIGDKISDTSVMDWESAKLNRGTMNEIYKQLSGTSKNELSGVYKKLKGALSYDMDYSIQHDWDRDARKAVTKANTLSMQMANKYNNKLAKTLLDETGDPELVVKQLFNKALGNPEEAAKFVNAVGDKRELGAEYVTRAFRNSEGADGSFDGKSLKDYMLATRDVAKVPLSAPQRAGLDHLSTVLQHTGMSQSGSGTYALAFRQGSAIIGVSGALASLFSDDNIPSGAKYGAATLLAVPLAGAFTKKVLLNPTNVRKLALLAKLPPGSQKATLLSKSILTTLKGAGAEIQYYNQTNAPTEGESVEPE